MIHIGLRPAYALAVAAGASAVIAGCGSSGVGGASSPVTRVATAPPSAVPSAALQGVVVEGAAVGCRVLQTDADGRYALTGPGVIALRIGDRVAVVGAARPDLVSRCGRSFVVTGIEAQ